MPVSHLNIAVVGGGIGGPAAAIALARTGGHRVTVYERSTPNDVVGYAFRITANADRCLKFLGIDIQDGGAVTANAGRIMDAKGRVIHESRENEESGSEDGVKKKRKGTSVFAYRPGLQRQLLDRMAECGVHLKSGVKVVSVDIARSKLTFDDGSAISADLIVAADGLHSIVRPQIVDDVTNDQYALKAPTGHSCLRFTLPVEAVRGDLELSSNFIADDTVRMFSWSDGADRRIIVYPVDHGRLLNFVCSHPEADSRQETQGEDEEAVAYNHHISPEKVHSIYDDFDPLAQRLLDLVDAEGFRVWPLLDTDDIPHWFSHRTVLLGDAAHPLVPFGFSGAAMAIEDAVTLGVLMDVVDDQTELENRLAFYETLRRPRVERVRQSGRMIGRGLESVEFLSEYRRFLEDYDAVQAARDALQAHPTRRNSDGT